MNFGDDSSTFILGNRSIIFCLSLGAADGGNWAKEIKVNPAAKSCCEALCKRFEDDPDKQHIVQG